MATSKLTLSQLRTKKLVKAGWVEIELFRRQIPLWPRQPLQEVEANESKRHILLNFTEQTQPPPQDPPDGELHTPRFFSNSPVLIKFDNKTSDHLVLVTLRAALVK